MGRGRLCPPHLPPPHRLPVCCACPVGSSKPAEAEKEKAGTGARTDLGLQRPQAAQTSGCRETSGHGPEQEGTPIHGWGEGGLRWMWLGTRDCVWEKPPPLP